MRSHINYYDKIFIYDRETSESVMQIAQKGCKVALLSRNASPLLKVLVVSQPLQTSTGIP